MGMSQMPVQQIRVGGGIAVVDVVQRLGQSLEIADAVSVAVIKAVDKNLVVAAVAAVNVLGLGLVVLAHDAQRGGDVLLSAAGTAGERGAQGQRRQKQSGPSLSDCHIRLAAPAGSSLPPCSK